MLGLKSFLSLQTNTKENIVFTNSFHSVCNDGLTQHLLIHLNKWNHTARSHAQALLALPDKDSLSDTT